MTKTFEDLKREAEENDRLTTSSMHTLRDMVGHKALGTDVVRTISWRLQNVGLGHLPTRLPSPGDVAIVLYSRGTPAGALIEAVVKMTEGRELYSAIDVVRAAVATPQNDALEIVAKIRALLRDPPDGSTETP